MALKKTKPVDAILSKLEDVKIFFEKMRDKRQEAYDNKSEKYHERNKQDSNDFVPTDDCRSEFWLKDFGLRKQAFDIITKLNNSYEFTEISESDFNEKRLMLLNQYLSE